MGGSRKASLAAPVAAAQMCSAPPASQEAMRAGLHAAEERQGSQHRAVMGLLCPVYCAPARNHQHENLSSGAFAVQICSHDCCLMAQS